ncbi:hypothetical protein [Saccharopolyspora pogona]|uniref:hypothetical protein n=1 Tax=Saccharopolyspora pogona TaxID=333966 RepID=UPI0016897B77|nr:hypothetical protein [Saccharopolyspora pogona]
MSGELARKRTELELRITSETATEKSWHIPAQAGKGPVTVALRIPEVRVTDSAGRHILIGPEQADVLGSKLSSISDWLQDGDRDWIEPDA